RELLQKHWPALIASADPELLRGLTQMADTHDLPISLALISELATDESRSADVRAEALALLSKRQSPNLGKVLDQAFASSEPPLRITARTLISKSDPDNFFAKILSDTREVTLDEHQALYRNLGESKDPRSAKMLSEALQRLLESTLPTTVHLDVIEAARKHDPLKPQLAEYEKSLSKDDPLAPYRIALEGGHAERGRGVVHEHVSAQCLRCHNIDRTARQLGPNLSGVATRLTHEQLLESLIHPNAKIADGFGMISLTLKNQANPIAGTILEESENTLLIAQLSGDQISIDKAAVKEEQRLSVSSMPPMIGVLTLPEIRDVIAYLKDLKE
ncbi:MAG: hypothetical protein ACKVHP_20130, partial [Verrucomicrobiales bacterium]